MNFQALATELAKPEYASMSDQEAADAINAKTVTVRQLVETWRVKQYAIEQGVWAKLKLAKDSAVAPDELKGLCISILDWIDDSAGKIQTVDMDLLSVQYMLGGLVQASLATQEQVDAIIAMGSVDVSWTTHNGIGEVGRGLVQNIRRENA